MIVKTLVVTRRQRGTSLLQEIIDWLLLRVNLCIGQPPFLDNFAQTSRSFLVLRPVVVDYKALGCKNTS
jgi:hypothetical protein